MMVLTSLVPLTNTLHHPSQTCRVFPQDDTGQGDRRSQTPVERWQKAGAGPSLIFRLDLVSHFSSAHFSFLPEFIERQVQSKDIDSRLAKDAELPSFGIGSHKSADYGCLD